MPVSPPPPPAPDPIVAQVADANLEPEVSPRTWVVTLALGGSFTLGLGVEDATGRGGGGSLRLARKMAPRWYLDVELATGTALHELAQQLYINTATGLFAGAQYYVNGAFYLRGGLGFGAYDYRSNMPDKMLDGPAALGGAGVELARWSHVGLDLEFRSISIPNREGLIVSSGVELGLSIY